MKRLYVWHARHESDQRSYGWHLAADDGVLEAVARIAAEECPGDVVRSIAADPLPDDVIREAAAELAPTQPSWIPVGERVPDTGRNVLVYRSGTGPFIAHHSTATGTWYTGGGFPVDPPLTHWMDFTDLPAPPEAS